MERICAKCQGSSDDAGSACALCGEDPRLDGRWTLRRVLGSGAHGTTYLGEGVLGEQVAIKELSVRKLRSLKALELFEREASTLRTLTHPGVPRYVAHLDEADGKHVSMYLVQEFIDGPTLEEELATRRFTEEEVGEVVVELLDILAYLHGLVPPVIHRDIKPRNIMRRADGSLALIDFGAVREAISDPEVGGSTIAGTFGFMAPEQFAGQATPATDLYAVGVTALSLHARRDPQEFIEHGHTLRWRGVVPMSDGFAALLGALLEPNPTARASSAAAVRADWSAFIAGRFEAPARPAEAPERLRDIVESRRADGEGDAASGAEDGDVALLAGWLLLHAEATRKVSLRADEVARDRLREAAAGVIRELGSSVSADVNVPFLTATESGPVHYKYTLTRGNWQKIQDRTLLPEDPFKGQQDLVSREEVPDDMALAYRVTLPDYPVQRSEHEAGVAIAALIFVSVSLVVGVIVFILLLL